jgi:hypothetical protein
MDIEERIKKDIKKFEENSKKLENQKLTKVEKEIFMLSQLYKKDSIYYLEKKDFLTSFSCISYAHGLLDSLLRLKNRKLSN